MRCSKICSLFFCPSKQVGFAELLLGQHVLVMLLWVVTGSGYLGIAVSLLRCGFRVHLSSFKRLTLISQQSQKTGACTGYSPMTLLTATCST